MPAAEVADQLELSRADVHRALTYYYEHPDEMADIRARHREAMDAIAEKTLEPPEPVSR